MSVFELFDDYGQRREKITLPGDVKQWTWFKIYLFSKNKTDLFEMLKFLNSLLIRHTLFGYEEFSACIVNSILPQKPNVFFFSRKKKNEKKEWINL